MKNSNHMSSFNSNILTIIILCEEDRKNTFSETLNSTRFMSCTKAPEDTEKSSFKFLKPTTGNRVIVSKQRQEKTA